MTINDWLHSNTDALRTACIDSARLDCLVLLEDALDKNRANLLAHPEQEIPPKTEVNLNNKVIQRSQHVPLAYIRGKAEFYGREFAVNDHVMVPRPETEAIITLALEVIGYRFEVREQPWRVADVGTGSGSIAISMKLECPDIKTFATDISKEALKVARKNAKSLGADINLYHGDLLEPIYNLAPNTSHLLVLANLPYVPDNLSSVNQAAKHEPRQALFAGKDGLDVYRRFWTQISSLKQKPKYILTESLDFQHDDLHALATKAGYNLQTTESLVQLFVLKR